MFSKEALKTEYDKSVFTQEMKDSLVEVFSNTTKYLIPPVNKIKDSELRNIVNNMQYSEPEVYYSSEYNNALLLRFNNKNGGYTLFGLTLSLYSYEGRPNDIDCARCIDGAFKYWINLSTAYIMFELRVASSYMLRDYNNKCDEHTLVLFTKKFLNNGKSNISNIMGGN